MVRQSKRTTIPLLGLPKQPQYYAELNSQMERQSLNMRIWLFCTVYIHNNTIGVPWGVPKSYDTMLRSPQWGVQTATIPCWVELSNGELSRGNNPKVTFWPFCTIATIPLVVYYEYEATTQKWYPTIFLFCKRFPNGLHLVYHDTTKNYSTSLQWRGKGDIQPFFLKFLLRHYIRTSTSTPHSV